jgi:hypothetical protein
MEPVRSFQLPQFRPHCAHFTLFCAGPLEKAVITLYPLLRRSVGEGSHHNLPSSLQVRWRGQSSHFTLFCAGPLVRAAITLYPLLRRSVGEGSHHNLPSSAQVLWRGQSSQFTLFCAGPLARAVMAFSVRKNVAHLLSDLPAEGDINCIYGVRALCTIALYLAHKVITFAFSPYFNRVKLTEVT